VCLIRTLVSVLGRALRTLLRPARERDRFLRDLAAWLERWRAAMAVMHSLKERVALIRRMPDDAFSFLLPQFVPRFAVGMANYRWLTLLTASLDGDRIETRAMMRGLPNNVTTEMDLALWQTARAIRADPTSLARHRA
jgi:pyruvate,water dikinase